MKRDEIDRILADDNGIAPSSGFAGSVMEAVRLDAITPPPIPFPWKRGLPALAAGCAVVIVAAVSFVGHPQAVSSPAALEADWALVLATLANNPETTWILAATLLTIAAVRVSLRLGQGQSY